MVSDRVEQRTRSALRALMRDSRSEREICIMDMSTRGLLATTANPPRRGEFVELAIGRNRLTAQVKWSSQRRFGLSLRERISVADLLSGARRPAQPRQSRPAAPRHVGQSGSLNPTPQPLLRAGQYGLFAFAAVAAGYFFMSTSEAGFAPIQQAFGALDQGKAD